MNILVLGGNGFIGSNFVRALVAEGHHVRVFDRSPERFRNPPNKVDYRIGDFNDTFMISEALIDMDVVIHLISTTVPGTSNLDPAEDIRNNLINTIRLFEQMKARNIKRIVYLSSGGTVYGKPNQIPIPEDHPFEPMCSYGIVKISIEKYLLMYKNLYGFEPLILRPSNPYGPGQTKFGVQGLIGTFLMRILEGKTLEVWGNGEIVRDYIYIDDLVSLMVMAVESSLSGVFNVGSGQGHSVNEIIKVISFISQSDIPVNYIDARPYDVPEVVLDINKAKKKFNWQPKVDLQAGIKKYFEYLSGMQELRIQ